MHTRWIKWFKSRLLPATKHDLRELIELIVMNQKELADGLTLIKDQVGKVATEQSNRFDVLTAKVAELQAALDNAGSVSPEVTDALAGVQVALQSLDDTIPDAPTAPPV